MVIQEESNLNWHENYSQTFLSCDTLKTELTSSNSKTS